MILIGDCRESMRSMAENSVDAIVTDPPYGLSKEPDMAEVLKYWLAGDDYTHTGNGFMGKKWDSFVPGPVTWREAYRVLKPGGYALVFAGSRTQDLMSIALRLAGFEIRDTLMWLYGSGFPKSLNVSKAIDKAAGVSFGSKPAAGVGFMGADGPGSYNPTINQLYRTGDSTEQAKQWEGWGTALKPAYEPVIMARKPLIGTMADSVLTWGTGAINIDGCRIGTDLIKTNGRGSQNGNAPIGEQSADYVGGQRQGRWPANVLHDGSPEVLAGFPDSKGQQGDLKATGRPRPSSGRFGDMAPPHAHPARTDLATGAARFFYCAKTSKADRNEGCEHLAHATAGEMTGGRAEGSDGLKSPRAGAGCTSGAQNHHPTVKPTELMRYLCRLVTPPGGLVLDPFAGSGSTGKAAILEGFEFVGCELSEAYAEIARARIDHALYQRFMAVHGGQTD